MTTVGATAQNEALAWNDAGQLAQASITPSGGSAKNTSYVYDASGALLLTADPGTTTLYLPDEELSLSTSTGTVTGTRYYSIGGATVAARTGASTLAYLAGDTQGTDSVAIDSSTLGVTRRYYDPYGNPRGTVPGGFPAGEKGFVGGAADTATGLTDLGVREYQPGSGSFISPDPLLKPYDPQGLNAYAYAEGNPSTYSDPTGAIICDPNGKCGNPQALNTYAPKTTDYIPPRGSSPSPSSDVGNRKVCEIGRGCAPLHVFLTRHDVDDRKSAPVTRKHSTSGDGCGGFHAALRGWQGACHIPGRADKPLNWWDVLTVLAVGAALVCLYGTDGTGVTLCAQLADGSAVGRAVIGKLSDLEADGALGRGDRTLLERLPNRVGPRANWAQNSSVLRNEMAQGLPIRDASVNPATGALENNTGFLRAERALLRDRGWTYDPKTTLWSPP